MCIIFRWYCPRKINLSFKEYYVTSGSNKIKNKRNYVHTPHQPYCIPVKHFSITQIYLLVFI